MAYQAKTIRKMIAQVCAQADQLKARVHKLSVVILDHYRQHGDTSLMAELVNELKGRGQHRRALIQWFQRHGRVVLTVQDDKVKFVKKQNADHTTIDIDRANTSPYYDDDSTDGRTGDDLKSFNFWGRVRSAIKREREIKQAVAAANGDFKAAGYDPDKTPLIDDDMLSKMEEFVEMYGELDKPQPKSDKPLFKGSHAATTDEPKLAAIAG